MHSKGMYLGLQNTKILVGFLRVSAVVRQKACMHAIGANDIRRGAYMATPADRMHMATGLGARLSNQQRGRGVYASCLWPTMRYWGFLEGARDFKARSIAKKHTNEVQSGGRDPGVSRPLCGRPLDIGKRCVAAFRHGALNWQGAPTFTAPLAVDRVYSCHLRPTTTVEGGRRWPTWPHLNEQPAVRRQCHVARRNGSAHASTGRARALGHSIFLFRFIYICWVVSNSFFLGQRRPTLIMDQTGGPGEHPINHVHLKWKLSYQ